MKKFAVLFALFAAVGLAQADAGLFGTMDAGYNSTKATGAATSTSGEVKGAPCSIGQTIHPEHRYWVEIPRAKACADMASGLFW